MTTLQKKDISSQNKLQCQCENYPLGYSALCKCCACKMQKVCLPFTHQGAILYFPIQYFFSASFLHILSIKKPLTVCRNRVHELNALFFQENTGLSHSPVLSLTAYALILRHKVYQDRIRWKSERATQRAQRAPNYSVVSLRRVEVFQESVRDGFCLSTQGPCTVGCCASGMWEFLGPLCLY